MMEPDPFCHWSLRASAKGVLDHQVSRRKFVLSLTGASVYASAAQSLAASLVEVPKKSSPGVFFEGTGGELMAQSLQSAGIKYVFGIPGTDEVGFVDALVDHPEIQYVLGLHEGPIAAMADGYAKVSGSPAFLNVHTIAGMANVLGQLVNSSEDSTPIVLTAGNQDSRLRGRGSFLESPHLETLPQNYAKWGWDVLRADTIPDVLHRGFKLASTPPGGPVFITFSKDLWKQRDVRAEIPRWQPFDVRTRLLPDPRRIEAAARLLVEAAHPVLMAGTEINKYGGRRQLVELAESLAAPVVGELATGHGAITFPTRHPQYLGLFPGQKQFGLPMDVLFSAGARMFSEFDYTPEPIIAPEVRTIQVSLDAISHPAPYRVDIPIVASLEASLDSLLDRVKTLLTAERRGQNPVRLEAIAGTRNVLVAARDKALKEAWASEPISPARLAAELNQALDPQAIVVTETVTSDFFHSTYIDYNNAESGRLHVLSHGGVLGWGVGAACGVKLAAPAREVVLLTGDGSFQFGVQGLWTAARYEIPILCVIWNNQNYQSNRLGLVQYGGRAAATGKYIGTYLGDPEIDHISIARGYGVAGERVAKPDLLNDALARALRTVRQGKPYVLDVMIARRFQGADVAWHEKFSVARMQ